MESLARLVLILWLLSLSLSLTALLFAILYRKGKARLRGAMFWLLLSAADIVFYLFTSWRFVVVQSFIWVVAALLTRQTAKSASPTP